MQQIELKETYIVKCKGTPILGSVCSFAHDHAILKMIDVLGRLEKNIAGNATDHMTYQYRVNYITCGGDGKLPVEYCEAEIEFQVPADVKSEQVKKEFDALIKETGYEGISYDIVTDRPFTPDKDSN